MYDLNEELQAALSAVYALNPLEPQDEAHDELQKALDALYEVLRRQRSSENWGGVREGVGRPLTHEEPLDQLIVFKVRQAELEWLEQQGQQLGPEFSASMTARHLILKARGELEPPFRLQAQGLGDGRTDQKLTFNITATELEQLEALHKVAGFTKSKHLFARQLLREVMPS